MCYILWYTQNFFIYWWIPGLFPCPSYCKLLGTTLSGFRSYNHPWLSLSERPWHPKPLRRQSLAPWQEHHLCLLYFTLPSPQYMTGWPMTGKIPQERDDLIQAQSWGGPQGRTWGAMEKGGDGPSPLSFDKAWVLILSFLSRSLLISWLPYFPHLT